MTTFTASGASSPWAADTALTRGGEGYFDWLDHIWPAAGCTHPIRLHGDLRVIDPRTGELLRSVSTLGMPDQVIYKACGNRRTAVCPSCAETYRRDAYQVIRSGLVGGKGVPDTVATHPAVFATFTAPSFGPVHTRVIRQHTCTERAHCRCRPEPCHARRQAGTCEHGQPIVCFARHDAADPRLGQPLCPDCYDYAAHVVWNNAAGELWRRTKQAIERHLASLARRRGLPPVRIPCGDGKYRPVPPVRVSHGKAAEFQARGAVHFHALLRLDGVDPSDLDAIVPPPAGIAAADLDDAIHHAAQAIHFTTPLHPAQPDGWLIEWGDQVDVRVITMRGGNSITDAMVAGYLAKYATKGTEITGHTSARITDDTIDLSRRPRRQPRRTAHPRLLDPRPGTRLSLAAPLGTHARIRRPLPHQRTPLLRHLRNSPQRPGLLPAQRDDRARTRPDPHRRPHRRRNHPHHRRPPLRRNRLENHRRRLPGQHRRRPGPQATRSRTRRTGPRARAQRQRPAPGRITRPPFDA